MDEKKPGGREQEAAALALARLDGQAEGLRAELLRLRCDLAAVHRGFSATRGRQLMEANEQLVLAALHAEAEVDSLGERARKNQRDALTHTPNRALMLDRVESAIALARRRGTCCALLFVDLDRFKQINDAQGRAAGDEVLRLSARRMESVLRESDTVSRQEGDQFLVLLAEVAHAADAARTAEKMLSAIATPSRIGAHVLCPSASIGIAVFPEDGEDAPTLVLQADAAMYRAKRRGRGNFQLRSEAPGDDDAPKPSAAVARSPVAPELEAPPGLAPRIRGLREANEQLVVAALTAQELKARAEEAHSRQIKLFEVVAHELRRQLGPIRAAAEQLAHSSADEALLASQRETLTRQLACLSSLVDELLDGLRGGIASPLST